MPAAVPEQRGRLLAMSAVLLAAHRQTVGSGLFPAAGRSFYVARRSCGVMVDSRAATMTVLSARRKHRAFTAACGSFLEEKPMRAAKRKIYLATGVKWTYQR